jgi:hypothetical protein
MRGVTYLSGLIALITPLLRRQARTRSAHRLLLPQYLRWEKTAARQSGAKKREIGGPIARIVTIRKNAPKKPRGQNGRRLGKLAHACRLPQRRCVLTRNLLEQMKVSKLYLTIS